jgi:hypothetical protein
MAIPDYLESTTKDLANQATAAYSAPINTSTFAQQIAGQDPAQQQAYNLATQGVGSYQPYLQAAQAAQAQGAGQLGLAGQTLGAVGSNINQAGSALGQAGAAYGGMGGYQAAGGAAAQNAGNIAQGAAGMTGPNSYQQFMSPYQSQVIDATLSEFDKQRLGGEQQIKDAAVGSGNFGGGREGAQLGQYQANSLADRSALQSSMLQSGYQNAQQAAQQNFANQGDLYGMQQGLGNMQSNLFQQQGQMGQAQQGLANSYLGRGSAIQGLSAAQQGLAGAYGNQMNQQFGLSDFNRQGMGQDINALGSLGAANQAQQQAILNANSQNAQTAAYEPYNRLTQYGNMITGLGGGVAGGQYQQQQASNPYQAALGTATGLAGLYGKLFG